MSYQSCQPPHSERFFALGPVDGFDQEEDTSESDESGIVSLCFLTSHGHAFETLDLADQLLDPGAQLVEPPGEEFRSVLGRASMRNDRDDPSAAGSLAVGCGIVSLVGDGGPRRHVRANVEERFELAAITGLVAGQVKVERQAVEVALDVDLGAEAAAWSLWRRAHQAAAQASYFKYKKQL